MQKLYCPVGDKRQVITLLDPGDPETMRNADGSIPPPSVWKSGVWAKVELLQGRELLQSQAIVQEVTHRVTIHYDAGVRSRMFVQMDDGRLFEVQVVQDPDELKVDMYLLCVERDDGK